MKKSLYSILAAATLFGFAACDDGNYSNWADPIVNPQAEVKPGVSVAFTSTGSLIDYKEVGLTVKLFNASGAAAQKYEVVFSNGTVIGTDANGLADVFDFKSVVEALYGKAPVERTIEAKAVAYLTVDGAGVKVEKPIEIKAILDAPQISENYYLIGQPSTWDPKETSLKFNHSGKNVYEDPIFTITFPVTAGDTWFAFTDDLTVESEDWMQVFGCTDGNGKNGMDGYVARRKDLADDGSFMLHADADCYVKMTLNMMDYTYHFDFINYEPFIYFIGATDGWTNAEQKLALTDENTGTYTGYLYCADPNGWGNQFKFQTVPGDWNSQINAGNFTTFSGDVEGKADGNLAVTGGESVYYFSVSLGKGEIYAQEVKVMGIIGNFNGWGGDLEMTWNAAEWCYEADMTPVDQDGWKFRVNNDWGLNLGGASYDNLVNGGDNLNGTGAKCRLYPTRIDNGNIYCVVE